MHDFRTEPYLLLRSVQSGGFVMIWQAKKINLVFIKTKMNSLEKRFNSESCIYFRLVIRKQHYNLGLQRQKSWHEFIASCVKFDLSILCQWKTVWFDSWFKTSHFENSFLGRHFVFGNFVKLVSTIL